MELSMNNDQLSIKFPILKRTLDFSVRTIAIANTLPKTPAGFAFASQVVRSGTSIGANLHEAQIALEKKVFIHCLTISLKEARETKYWLMVILGSELVEKKEITELIDEIDEIVKILFAIIKSSAKRIVH